MTEPYEIKTVRITQRAVKEFEIMKQTGHAKNLSKYVEGRIHDDFMALFPSGRKQAIDEMEETLKRARLAVKEIDDMEKDRLAVIDRIMGDYKRRADRLYGKDEYPTYQKNWLAQYLSDVAGACNISDIDTFYSVMEERRVLLKK